MDLDNSNDNGDDETDNGSLQEDENLRHLLAADFNLRAGSDDEQEEDQDQDEDENEEEGGSGLGDDRRSERGAEDREEVMGDGVRTFESREGTEEADQDSGEVLAETSDNADQDVPDAQIFSAEA